MVSRRAALAAVLGILLVGSFLVAPATDPPDTYVVTVEQPSANPDLPSDVNLSNPTPYANLSANYQAVVDAALANDGRSQYSEAATPEGVVFPDTNGLRFSVVERDDTTYLVQFTHRVETPTSVAFLRTIASLVGGVALLAYAGYRRVTA